MEPILQFGPNAKSICRWRFQLLEYSDSPLFPRWDSSGIFEGFIPGIGIGALYKFNIESNINGYKANRGDPFAVYWEEPPKTSPIVWNLDY